MSEANALKTLRTEILENWPNAHWQRIESHHTPGLPDVNLCIPGKGEYWIEGKYLAEIPKDIDKEINIGLRIDQAMWLNTRLRAGGKALVCLRLARSSWAFFNQDFKSLCNKAAIYQIIEQSYYSGPRLDLEKIFNF